MLDGQGADEVLGGYHSYLTNIALMLLRKRRLLRYARWSRQYKQLLGASPMPLRHAVATMAPPGPEAVRVEPGRDAADRGG